MNLSDEGIAFIAAEEGFRTAWYLDALGNRTIGIGHLWNPDTDAAFEHRDLSEAEVWELFRHDARRYVDSVNACIHVPLTQTQFDRLVSFAFNWGIGSGTGFPATSVVGLINAGDFPAAAADLVDGKGPSGRPYDKGLAGVRNRRIREAEAFRTGGAMQEWMPGVEHIDRGGGTPVQDDGPTVIVLHTTETQGRASYSGTEPHFEIDRDGSILQYISLARTAKALYNYPGTGVETNRRRGRIVQYELVNRAAEVEDITDAQLDGLAESLRWVDAQLPFAKTAAPQGFHGANEGIVLASEDSPIRFSFADWEAFGGICGHQHVPENDHWDPGRFPLDRLLSRLSPQPVQEDDIMMIIGDAPPERGGGVWMSNGIFRKPVRTGDTWGQLGDDGAKVARHIGVFSIGTFDDLIDIEAALARIVVPTDGGALDYAALGRAVADELHGRLAG